MIRREPLIALAVLLLLQFAPFARAQTNAASSYPTKPIRFIVPYPPGGTTDIVARGIALKLSERTGQQVVIDNRAGASTILGAEAAAKSAPDGYTLLLATSTTMSINPQVFPKLPYDAVRDFAPISSAVYVPFVIATHPSVPANTITELIALAKANPGTIKYSTPGTASSNHVAGALLETMAGIKLLHVPYKGSAPAATAVLSGEVHFVITGVGTLIQHWKSGRLKILAFGSDKRHPLWPDIPCTGEAGLVGYEAGTWFGLFLPKGAPAAAVKALNDALGRTLENPAIQAKLRETGVTAVARDRRSPEYLGKFVADEVKKWEGPIKASGVSM